MLSILIPTYNYDITALVENLSVQLRQVDYDFEIIVADDGSTNKIIVNKNKVITQSNHCYYLIQEENKGRAFIRNFLAKKAQYDWLLFMDADVMPKTKDFIQKLDIKSQKADLIFGGISYKKNPPEKDKMLRWKYGKAREEKSVKERKQKPYLSIISGAFLIKKSLFIQASNFLENLYGEDLTYIYNYEKMNITVFHIDNPAVHLGLENTISFLEKTKKGLESLVFFENNYFIPKDYRPIQKAYLKLKKYRILTLFVFFMRIINPVILKNLNSGNPLLFLFDLFRLDYYIKIKK